MSSNTSLGSNLNDISDGFNRYFGIFIFLFGSVGNILNILALSQRPLRSNPCGLLFLVSSISNLIAILSGLTTRILSSWNIDPTSTIPWSCKLRVAILFPSRTAAYWFIMLAAIDRWLSSSVHIHYRRMSSIKNVYRGIIIIIIFSVILYIQAPVCYEINSNNFSLQCYGRTKLCRMSVDLTYGFITIFLPVILMNLFSLMTILNARQMKNRIRPLAITNITKSHQQQLKKSDHRLFLMLFSQTILFTLLAFPIVIQRIYTTVTMNNEKSELQNAIENFIFDVFLLLSFLANGIPFYIYTLTGGTTFRKAFLNVIHCVY